MHSKRILEITLLCTAWFAVILQLALLKESIFNFISYFTILCNTLVAISLTASACFPRFKNGTYFLLPTVQTAIALYIFIVGLVYNTVLRGVWEPKGWQLVADNLLHVVVPVLYVLYWIIFVEKGTLNWKNAVKWIYFPLLYLVYSLIRGHFVGWYPYPFLNVAELGYAQVLTNACFVMVAFFIFGAALIWADRLLSKKA